jgi:hypothetical protein
MSLLSNIWKTFVGSKKQNAPTSKQEVKEVKEFKSISRKEKIELQKTKMLQVKKHLIEKGTIDSWTAIELYGATRLSAIIFNLRMSGHNIDSIPRTAYDRNQELCNFTTYKYINYNGVN